MASPLANSRIRKLQKEITSLSKEAAEYQAKADQHHDSIFFLLTILVAIKEALDIVGFIVLGYLLTPLVWLINAYVWFTRRDAWGYDDLSFMGGTIIIESIPGLNILPAAIANILEKWWKSRLVAAQDKATAEQLQRRVVRLQVQLQKEMQQYRISAYQTQTGYAEEEPELTEEEVSEMLTELAA